MTVAFAEETIHYHARLRDRWRSGSLPRELRHAYPDLFDDDDLRLALSQPAYHFFEWLGALHYREIGFNVLVEQYVYSAHPRKIATVCQLISEDDLQFLRNLPGQPPDLLVHRGDALSFFVEVKSSSDSISQRQNRAFTRIVKRFSADVRVLRVLPK
ncbi:MAG: hypothetical protein IH866_04355 [Chloroflexi bacterium]|nr:hypothetical protein [Chloroflexota bacterium]